MNKIYISILITILLTTIIYYLPDKSNYSKYFMIPIMVVLSIKYFYGDWDKGYIYTMKDIYYYFIIISISMINIYILKNMIN